MADPSNTKPDPCSLDEADWVSATELGEIIVQINHGAWVLAYVDIREALLGGCGAALELELNGQKRYVFPLPGFWLPPDRLRWVNGLNPSMRREDYPDRPWPWELRAYLSPSEPWEFRHLDGSPIAREQVSTTLRVFLRRAEAAQWGLLPALESPQAVPSEEPPPPREQPGEPTVGPTGGEAASSPAAPQTEPVPPAPESPPAPAPPTTAKDWFRKAREAYPQQPGEETGDYGRRLEESMPQSKAGVKKPWETRGIIRRIQELRKAEVEAAAQKGRRPTGDR